MWNIEEGNLSGCISVHVERKKSLINIQWNMARQFLVVVIKRKFWMTITNITEALAINPGKAFHHPTKERSESIRFQMIHPALADM